ncbi:hypothetical protein ACHAWC_006471, partial [Mediolabrus comicus]
MKMGILDFLQENNPFLNSREGDFIPLNNNDDDNDDSIGPPLLILYAAPSTIGIDEYRDMVCDGMPNRRVVDNVVGRSDNDDDDNEKQQVIVIRRLDGMMKECDDNNNDDDSVLDLTVKDALDTLASSSSIAAPTITTSTSFNKSIAASSPVLQQKNKEMENNDNNTACPVLYFSGVTNTEMMTTYRIIANEIYQETNGVHWPACAKVVMPALVKPLRQVLCEISGDHADAMRLQRDDE